MPVIAHVIQCTGMCNSFTVHANKGNALIYTLRPNITSCLQLLVCMLVCPFSYHCWHRFTDYLTDKMPSSPPQASVPSRIYSLLIRHLSHKAVPIFKAKPCEWVGVDHLCQLALMSMVCSSAILCANRFYCSGIIRTRRYVGHYNTWIYVIDGSLREFIKLLQCCVYGSNDYSNSHLKVGLNLAGIYIAMQMWFLIIFQ